MQGNSEPIFRRTVGSFSLETSPVKALDARTRIRRLLWVEHLLMNGINRNGSKSSPLSLAIVEGLSLDKRIKTGHKLGWTTFDKLDSEHPDVASPSASVATFNSL